MGKLPRVKAGDPITIDAHNLPAEALERFANLSVAEGSYLTLWDGPDGKHLGFHPPVETLALLSGSTSPYSWVEVDEAAGGTFATRGVGDSGTSDAYEINGKSGLGGKVVSLTWTAVGDWRFQWVGYQTYIPCGGTTRICISATTTGCPAMPPSGASVVVKDNTGTTVGTCTTDATGACCVTVANSGPYTVTVTAPGATPVTVSVTAVCNVDNNVSVSFPSNSLGTVCFGFTHCGYANGGDSIAISKAGVLVATVVTDGSGSACAVLGVGSYTAVLTTPNGATKNLSFTVSACTTTNVSAGFSVTQVCFGFRTDPPAPCTATITVKNSDTGVTVGTGSLTTAFDGFIYYGVGCVTISELVSGVTFGFTWDYAFTNFSGSGGPATLLACYTSGSPVFADFRGAGAPC